MNRRAFLSAIIFAPFAPALAVEDRWPAGDWPWPVWAPPATRTIVIDARGAAAASAEYVHAMNRAQIAVDKVLSGYQSG